MFLTLGWLFVAHVRAQTPASTPFDIQGQLRNGTKNAPADSIANVPVTLFQITETGPLTRSVSTDAQGNFLFTRVLTDATSYFTRIDYAGVRYFSEIMPAELAAVKPISVTVYETQTVPADFAFDRVHLILDVQPKAFDGIQILQATNSTDRAFYVPLPLPAKTSDVRFEDFREQTRVIYQEDGAILYPILPTTTEILYGLALPYTPPDYTLTIPFKTDTASVNLLVSKSGDVRVSGSTLKPSAPFVMQSGQEYLVYAAPPQSAGTVFSATISNLPGVDHTPTIRMAILAAGGLAGLALLAYPVYRRRSKDKTAAPNDRARERAAQLQAIARLDDKFDANEIDEDAYLAERAALKAELLKDVVKRET
ncbi:MAG: hypothetical protein HY741_16515 [Chloroflexi bacterium]|nr:hypothetical protein [Chloroflexota bacterium]